MRGANQGSEAAPFYIPKLTGSRNVGQPQKPKNGTNRQPSVRLGEGHQQLKTVSRRSTDLRYSKNTPRAGKI